MTTSTQQRRAFTQPYTEVFIQDFVGKQTGTVVRYTQELQPGQAPIGVMTNLTTGTRREFDLSDDLMDTDPLNVWYPGMHWRIRKELTERQQQQRGVYGQHRKRYAGRWLKRDSPAVVR